MAVEAKKALRSPDAAAASNSDFTHSLSRRRHPKPSNQGNGEPLSLDAADRHGTHLDRSLLPKRCPSSGQGKRAELRAPSSQRAPPPLLTAGWGPASSTSPTARRGGACSLRTRPAGLTCASRT